MSKIEDIASVHLGKAGDGTVVKPYETPTEIDPSLLVGVPRVLNREQYNIVEDALPFVGVDTWNGYEFSCLMNNGFPVSGLVKWTYSADSVNIVESKSMKLYLNSFNMVKMGSTPEECIERCTKTIINDLRQCLQLKHPGDLTVNIFLSTNKDNLYADPLHLSKPYENLDVFGYTGLVEFNSYNESSDILSYFSLPTINTFRWHSANLRSNCRVTNQPDWGDVFVHIKGYKSVTPESLLQYIVSMRKENHFHEEICECIYKRLSDLLQPEELMVTCLYTRRGGIDINPVRANRKELLHGNSITVSDVISLKTLRQ